MKNTIKKILSGSLICCLSVLATGTLKAQTDSMPSPQEEISFRTYLNKVGKQNIAYLASKLDLSIAEAEIIAARTVNSPSLDLEGGYETLSIGLSYSIEFGKRRARMNAAKSQRDVERLNLEQGYQDLRAEAADLFLEAILQKELLDVKKSSYEYMLRLSKSDSLRFAAGELNENDARQSRLEAISLLNEVYDQEAAYLSSLVELNRHMGRGTDTLLSPVGKWTELSRDFSLDSLIRTGLDHRKDLMAAAKNIESSIMEYRLTRAERRPDLDISISYEREWTHLVPGLEYATLGLSLPLPFSNLNRGEVKAALKRKDQSVLMQKDMELQVRSEISNAWFEFQAQKKKVAQYRAGFLDESRKVMEGMVYTYNRGEASILDVLVAQRTYNEVCQDYLETMKEYVSALVSLEASCGIWDIDF